MPDERLSYLHLHIEYAVVQTLMEHRALQDKDVEAAYDQYRKYFRELLQGKEPAEPSSTMRVRGALLDNIWEMIVNWEDGGGYLALLNSDFRPAGRPIKHVEALFVMAFNDLRKSCRLYRKAEGPRGYVKFLRGFVADVLATNPDMEEDLLNPEQPQGIVDLEVFEQLTGIRLTLNLLESSNHEVLDMVRNGPGQKETSPEIIATWRKLAAKYPDEPHARAALSRVLFLDGQNEEGLALYRQLAEEYPEDPYTQGAYLDIIKQESKADFLSEAERLRFPAKITDFPPDGPNGYCMGNYRRFTKTGISLALARGDESAAAALFEPILKSNFHDDLVTDLSIPFLDQLVKNWDEEGRPPVTKPICQLEEFPLTARYIAVNWSGFLLDQAK